MAGLRELKNRLSSINTVGQLAGAMRTVSTAKYSRVSGVRREYEPYAQGCRALMRRFGGELSAALPCTDPDAPVCYVIMAGNRGLCGGYNAEIQSYGGTLLKEETRPYRLVTVGKTAETYFREAGFFVERAFDIPDVPDFDACRELLSYLRDGFTGGEISAVYMVYQKFINMLSREVRKEQILPLETGEAELREEALLIPDGPTVLERAALSCVDSVLYSCILEASACAQAATLVAMRSAYDNAQESIADLEAEISRRRQSEVTAGVLETASDNAG